MKPLRQANELCCELGLTTGAVLYELQHSTHNGIFNEELRKHASTAVNTR
jgi:hypothetical protein